MTDELERLRRWKAEAVEVLNGWERVHDALGKPARPGESKHVAAAIEVERLRRYAPSPEMEALLGRSSLGTDEAAAARESVSPDAAMAVVRMASLMRELTTVLAAIGLVKALHVPWYEIAGVRHEFRVMVGWDEAPDDHVCVIGRSPTRMDVCDPSVEHAVLACAECRASGGDDIDVAYHPFWPCKTYAVIDACTADGGDGETVTYDGFGAPIVHDPEEPNRG
jgi:hypothetical protein